MFGATRWGFLAILLVVGDTGYWQLRRCFGTERLLCTTSNVGRRRELPGVSAKRS